MEKMKERLEEKMKEVVIRIRPGGRVECLHDETLGLEDVLALEEVVKAGNVEFSNAEKAWVVEDARTGERIFSHPKNRGQCLEAEHAHYTELLVSGFRPFDEVASSEEEETRVEGV